MANLDSRAAVSLPEIQITDTINIMQLSQEELTKISAEKERRVKELYDTVTSSLNTADNIAVVVHADYLQKITSMAIENSRVSIVLPQGKDVEQFQDSRLRIEVMGMIEKYKEVNKYLDNTIQQNPRLKQAYEKFLDSGELPRDKSQI